MTRPIDRWKWHPSHKNTPGKGEKPIPPAPELAPVPRWRRNRARVVLLLGGIACIVAGFVLLIGPVFGVWQRGQNDQSAVHSWQSGGSAALAGPIPSSVPVAKTLNCGSATSTDYALVQFLDPSAYHYAGVAGDGNWDSLHSRSMVHYHGTPDPGQQGNAVLAFHREPDYEHIDQLAKGGIITVQDRACHTWRYQVTEVTTIDPTVVTEPAQLQPTSGHDLTLITCTPWWVDSQRIIWRASLIK